MKIKHTILALVILLVLGGAFYYLNQQPERPDPNAIPKEKLFSFTADQVEEFAIEIPPQPPASFRRVASTEPPPAAPPAGESSEPPAPPWEIVTPEGIAADSSLIQSFVEELPNLQTTPLAGETAAPVWSEYGLDQPQRVMRVKLKDGKEVALSVGKENPSGYARYGRRDDTAPVLLLDTTDNKSLLEKTLFDLRDKRILPLDFNQATRLEIRFRFGEQQASAEELGRARELGLPTKPARIVVTKQPNGNWQLDVPRLRTDHGNTNYLITMLTGAIMKSIEEEKASSLAKYGLNTPQIRVDITTPQGISSLLVGNMKKEGDQEFFYAKNSTWPHVFTILRTAYDQINQDLDAYRNRYLFDFETSNAKRLEVVGPTGEFIFGRRGEEWFKAGSPETKMAERKVENFLNDVHSLRISSYTSDEPNRFAAYGLNNPWMRIKITFGDQNQEEIILFSRRNNKFYAARQGEPSVYELSPTEPENLESKLSELTTDAPAAGAAPSPPGP
jgi:hypothetical protein